MDIQMPVLDGLDATKKILVSDQTKTPIFALSANTFVDDIKKAQDIGFSGYLKKPIRKETLLTMINDMKDDDKFFIK